MSQIVLRPGDASLRERSRGRRASWSVDPVLLGAVVLLVGLGALLVWSATRPRLTSAGLDPQAFLFKHLVNAAIGGGFAVIASLFDYRALRAWTPVLFGLSCLGLVAVLSPLGSTINGAHSWILLPAGFQVQPSEFAKVALVVGIALILAERADGRRAPRHRDVLLALGLAALPMGLVMLQPDLGTTLVLTVIVLGALTVSAAPARWVLGLLLAGAVVSVGAVQLGVLEDYQLDRFTAFADPDHDLRGAGYNTNQARIAIGSGGLTGKGLFQGTQTNGAFIPEQQTDFVFTVAGEELGLVGATAIVGLLGVVLWRGLRIAARASDLFGRLVASGVVSWFAFQSFVNIGMTLGIMPVTGLPLPFVSYGGSAMFANLIAVGLLLNVHRGSLAAARR